LQNHIWCLPKYGSEDYNSQKKLFSELEIILLSKYDRKYCVFEKEIDGEPPLCLQTIGTLILFKFPNQKRDEEFLFNAEIAGHEVIYENNKEKIIICLKWFLNNVSINAEAIADWLNKEWVYTG
jgi:hypothetical protein